MFENIKKWFDEKVKPLFHDKWQVRLITCVIGSAAYVGFVQRSANYPVWTALFWLGSAGAAFYLVSKPK